MPFSCSPSKGFRRMNKITDFQWNYSTELTLFKARLHASFLERVSQRWFIGSDVPHSGLKQQLPGSSMICRTDMHSHWLVQTGSFFAAFKFQSLPFPYIGLYIWSCVLWERPQPEALCSGTLQLVIGWITIPERNPRISIIGMNMVKRSTKWPIYLRQPSGFQL